VFDAREQPCELSYFDDSLIDATRLFLCSPFIGAPYDSLLVETGHGGITTAGFQARWALLTAQQPRGALEHILYLGFEGDGGELFRISRSRRAEQRAKGDAPARSVYQVLQHNLKSAHE